jgi:hypothetical protein
MVPTVFMSYSHDDEAHKAWVLQLAHRLRSNGVDLILDRWNVKLGTDLPAFMEHGLSEAHRVICVCSSAYVEKANSPRNGVGYEKQIITGELLRDLSREWVIPVIRNNNGENKLPLFLSGRAYVNFEADEQYEARYEELLRDIHNQPVLPIPPIGTNPFTTIEYFAAQKFIPSKEKYVSPAPSGVVTFDYSNNNGRFCIGQNELMFELAFSKASDRSIHTYTDGAGVRTVAIARGKTEINEIVDAREYDASSRVRSPSVDQVVVWQNTNGFYAATKILKIMDDTRGSDRDGITFEYAIQTNGSPDFTTIR